MKMFRFRFILLGLLLCLYHVWCLTCGTDFDDTASSAYTADIVIIGTFTQQLPPIDNIYNATVTITKNRNVLKGESLLKSKRLLNRRGSSLLTIGKFGKHSPEYCIAEIKRDEEYIFFLNTTVDIKYFKLSAMPLSTNIKKLTRRAKKDIKKILCNKPPCVKIPDFDPKKRMKDQTLGEGKKLELNCRLKRKPVPNAVFTWLKDGKDINTLPKKKVRIRTTKKGSRLSIRRTVAGDSGTYECIARNVGGSVKQEAVITVGGNSPPEAEMKDKKQKFGGTLRLTCKIKSAEPVLKYTWQKDGKELKTGDKKGLTIRSKGDESKLRITSTLLSDEGIYTCIATTSSGETIQQSNVSVFDGPVKTAECDADFKDTYCLNGGNCSIYVDLNETFCTCPRNYKGRRCEVFSILDVKRSSGEEKLAQDRTFIVVGIISGILLFIGICVASYFLAKRRRDQFHRRRRQRANGNIEDNIPQVYRPLIGCDDIDGLTKKMNGVLMNKETQTTETCFLTSDKTNLYINPLEGYPRNDGGDRNSRSRKAAVSLEDDPRRRKSQNNDPNDKNERRKSNPVDRGDRNDKDNKGGSIGKHLNVDGAPGNRMNDLSPRHTPIQKVSDKPVGANHNPNIPSPKSTRPPALNLDTDSDEEIPVDGTPLTPLHISEEEDESELFKKCKPKRTEEENNELFKKCKLKATALQAFGPRKQYNVPKPKLEPVRKQENIPKSNSKETNMTLPIHSPENNTAVSTNGETDTPGKRSKSSSSANEDSDSSSSTTEGCDSPGTAWANSQEFSDISPTPPKTWNERGSPEHTAGSPPSYFNIMKGKVRKAPFTNKGRRYPPETREEDRRNNRLRTNIKDKFSIAI